MTDSSRLRRGLSSIASAITRSSAWAQRPGPGTTRADEAESDEAQRLRRRLRRQERELEALRDRVALLEDEVQEARQLGLRVAELGDVVAELLGCIAAGDDERFRQALAAYTREL